MVLVQRQADDALFYNHSLDDTPTQDSFVTHAHDLYEILFFVSGHGVYLVESAAYPLTPGCILVMRPGEVHKLHITPDAPYERVVVHFRERALMEHTDAYRLLLAAFSERPLGESNRYSSEEIDSDFVRKCLERIEDTDSPELTRLVASAMLPAILSELYRGYRRRQRQPQPDIRIPQTRIRDILQYVNGHLCEELTLDDLCRRFYISKTQLGRLFRAATGSTAWDYILVKRLILARQLILSGVPITEASVRSGFRDYSAFYRAYKKRYASSPATDRVRTLEFPDDGTARAKND